MYQRLADTILASDTQKGDGRAGGEGGGRRSGGGCAEETGSFYLA